MSKILRCAEVVSGCAGEMRAGSVDEVLRLAAEHAKSAHGMHELDAETVTRVRAAIRDEGDSGAR